MIQINKILLLFIVISSQLHMQDCPPIDTLMIEPLQNLWNMPIENQWDEIELMTWNIKDFPISTNTINYVIEIITDLLPDVIAFQEINNAAAFSTLENSIPSYAFISSGNGLALGVRSDVVEILAWSTLFQNAGYEFAWRNPLRVELSWICGESAISLEIINVHLKSGSSSEDFNRRFSSCEYLSDYVNNNTNTNIIILGDYNDEITDSENNNSLFPLIINDDVEFATDPIANIDYYASYPSWPSFIDHIALSSTLFEELITGNIKTIRLDDYTGYSFYQNYISDHRPVIWSFPIEYIEIPTGLIINEIMTNPVSIPDAAGEWIELTNISEHDINLNGLILSDQGGEHHIISDNNLVIYPNEFIILGSNSNQSENGNLLVHYEYNGFTLSNLWDEVILSHPSGIIVDEVYYDNGDTFPDVDGKSMMLINPNLDNYLGGNWSVANVLYSSGDFGTPGEANFPEECAGLIGDLNGDSIWNILDIVTLANCIVEQNCFNFENSCTADVNQDNSFNVLDIVMLANCVLQQNCDSN